MTVISVVIGSLATVTKGLAQGFNYFEIRRLVETIQTPALLRSAGVLRRISEHLWDFAVTQILVENLQLSLVWKILKWVIQL